jgi:YVTN family beta-propeller protein
MSPEHTAVPRVRAARTQIRVRQAGVVLVAICCFLSAVSGQWYEKAVALSDSFGDMQPNAVYYVPGSNYVYVAGDDGVMVIDASTHARVARIDMSAPMFMAVDARDNKIYMGEEESLAVIDPVTHKVVSRMWVGGSPCRLTYNSTANKVYCLASSGLDTLVVVDCSTDSVLASIWVGRNSYSRSGICCNPAGNKVYVSEYEEGEVAVIDGAGDSLLGTVYLGDCPAMPTYSPVSNKVYCADYEDEEVAVIDAGPDTLLKLIELDLSPVALGYNPVSNKVYCGDIAGRIHIIGCDTDTVLASLDLAIDDPKFFLFDSVDNRVFCFPDYYTSIPAISGSGDTLAGWVTFHGDVYDPDPACYNPLQNRLYIHGRSSADVGVVDAASCELVSALPMSFAPLLGCYIEPHDKLYCSDDQSGLIGVVNCSTDSLERRILTPAYCLRSPVYSSGSDKLYYGAWLGNGCVLQAVDCAHDSFAAMLPLNFDAAPSIVYNPAVDRIYWAGNLGESTIVVVDCASDSVVAEVPVGQNPCGLTCNPDSNRVYCASYRGDSMFVSAIDCTADSVTGTVFVRDGYYSGPELMCYVPSQDVVVCTTPDNAVVLVDGAAKQLVGYVQAGGNPRKFHLDRALDKLYCLLNDVDDVAVIDCRDMTLQAKVRLAHWPTGLAFDSIANRLWVTSPDYGCVSLVDGRTNRFLGLLEAGDTPGDITWAPQHRKMYAVDQGGQAILVLRDTSLAGVCESPVLPLARAIPTVVRDVLFLPLASGVEREASGALLDISGRKVMELKPGANDIRHLAPGVYFLREEPQAASPKPRAVRKIVVTR